MQLGSFGGGLFIIFILGFSIFILIFLKGKQFTYISAKKFQDFLQYSNKTDLYH